MLGDDEMRGLFKCVVDFILDLWIRHGLMNGLHTLIVPEVGGGGVASVDSEELAFDEWLEILDPVDAFNLRVAGLEARSLNAPLVELFDPDVEAGIGRLRRYDTIDSGVTEFCLAGELFLDEVFGHVLLLDDKAFESVGGIDHVLAGNDG